MCQGRRGAEALTGPPANRTPVIRRSSRLPTVSSSFAVSWFTSLSGQANRGRTSAIPSVQIGPCCKEVLDEVFVASCRRTVQGSPPMQIPGVNICAFFQQLAN